MATRRKFDIVIFGATGFTGGLTAEYLARNAGSKLRWALAGRSEAKLKLVRERLVEINPALADLDLLQADVDDVDSIKEIAGSSKVVITTVGPYIRYGEPLVAACAAAGTDYVDLTGEPEFVDLMWLRYHELARSTGARIVNCCGFDSIPHDLGAYFTVQQLPQDVPLKVEGFVRAGGTFSGGTLHSAVTAFSRLREYEKVRKARRDREGYPVDRKISSTRQRIHYQRELGAWAVPMPTIDPQMVRRSAVADDRYGPSFSYGHYVLVKKIVRVAALVGGVGAIFAGAQIKFTREQLLKLKAPGDGPDEAQRQKGWFRVRFIGQGGGKKVVTEVSGGDPGYGETSKMLAESALCLAQDRLPRKAGVVTPAQAMGGALIERLQAAGISFKVLES
ncbi:saccharopine dehydrogenase family protein [Stenotrophobium rhamnosiphilum]|uniref:Saccharopine dehydrogenase n=1 Tax=Stenotrophobium rhamnosiphilum TaxID=2029166 RepID=A0A2T5MDU7_9GAMM|nr:saccharopine dehydrogenase NADP-binding domain-containing protein [Stenotrophobium rhamnosiphilum]PTU30746.1 saccharopine dehydrogenase [Stenotrophobium rhamnosiphilum]